MSNYYVSTDHLPSVSSLFLCLIGMFVFFGSVVLITVNSVLYASWKVIMCSCHLALTSVLHCAGPSTNMNHQCCTKDENPHLASDLRLQPVLCVDHVTKPVVLMPGIESSVFEVEHANVTSVQLMCA